MTGATGFLGHYVLRDLLTRGRRVVAVLRTPLNSSSSRLLALLAQIGLNAAPYVDRKQLLLVEGSMPGPLPEPFWGETEAFLNCAASLQLFSNGNGDPFKTNVDGTEAVIRWTREHGVGRIHAVSTAYTCGWNAGVIAEAFHQPAPKFQTDYERSKWQAEAMLQEWGGESGHILTVFRPSFLVGDSITGYTTQFAGFYQFARLVSVLKEQYRDNKNGDKTYIPLRIPGRPEDPQNIVPVDFVGRVIAEAVVRPQFHGKIYHVVNPEPPTNEHMKRCYEEYFGLHGGYFADPNDVVGKCSLAESLLWDQYSLLTPRVMHTPLFDVSNTRSVMEAAGLTFPALDQKRIFRLFDYAAASGWGRRTNGFHSHQ
jgi:nucleoside-diphosphate-sugar epimerase